MPELTLNPKRVIFFPVTPFGADGTPSSNVLTRHVVDLLAHKPGAVFPACGTGEFHALSLQEYEIVVRTVVDTVDGVVPVIAGTGGPLGHALEAATIAEDAGVDGLLVMPPYLVRGPQEGLIRYVRAIADATDLSLIIYHRENAQFTGETAARLFSHPKIIGFKDGVGDLAVVQDHLRAAALTHRADARFFNGLPTAELTQPAFDGIGVPHYSSAVFAMAPHVANAYLLALRSGDDSARMILLDEFYTPFVRLRDETLGFAISLIKAGLRLSGLDVGFVRPPLVDPTHEQMVRLEQILERGQTLAARMRGES